MRIGNYVGGMDIVLTGPEHKALIYNRCDIKVDIRGLEPPNEWITITGSSDGNNAITRRRDGTPFVRHRFPVGGTKLKQFSIEEVASILTDDGTIYGARPKMLGAVTPQPEVITGFKRVVKKPASSGRDHILDMTKMGDSVRHVNSFLREHPDKTNMWIDDEGVLHVTFSQTYEFSG